MPYAFLVQPMRDREPGYAPLAGLREASLQNAERFTVRAVRTAARIEGRAGRDAIQFLSVSLLPDHCPEVIHRRLRDHVERHRRRVQPPAGWRLAWSSDLFAPASDAGGAQCARAATARRPSAKARARSTISNT